MMNTMCERRKFEIRHDRLSIEYGPKERKTDQWDNDKDGEKKTTMRD